MKVFFQIAKSKNPAILVAMNTPDNNDKNAIMLGVGLDSDGHRRLTKGDNFCLIGGSQETHEKMEETALKVNEKLAKRGKKLADVSREEFTDILGEVTGK